MSKLLDLAPGGSVVAVRGKNIDVTGVGADGIVMLISRFGPQLTTLQADGDLSTASLFSLGPDAVAAVIAAGTGTPGDETSEAIARTLGAQAQLDLLAAIIRETMPGGLDPFVARVTEIVKALGMEEALEKITSQVSQAMAQTLSQGPSTNSSAPVTEPMKSGE